MPDNILCNYIAGFFFVKFSLDLQQQTSFWGSSAVYSILHLGQGPCSFNQCNLQEIMLRLNPNQIPHLNSFYFYHYYYYYHYYYHYYYYYNYYTMCQPTQLHIWHYLLHFSWCIIFSVGSVSPIYPFLG